MTWEKSCGAVVYTAADGQIQYLLAQSLEGVYGFPKGHMEQGESEVETALREVFEETNIRVSLLDDFRAVSEYPLPRKPGTMKQVVYFLGEYHNQQIIHQKEELRGARLVSYEEAMQLLRFEDAKQILTDANTVLRKRICEEIK